MSPSARPVAMAPDRTEEAVDAGLREQVAWSCRILAMGGHGDYTLGHVSARAAGGEHILMKPNGLGLEEVAPGDVLALDLEGAKLSGAGPIHLEYVLHTEIYKARPDVGAVVHTHPPYATAFGATDATLELLNHDAVLFREGLAYFDDTAELIVRPEQGAAVAAALGDRRVLVMRGHGLHRHRRDRALGDLRRAHPGAGAADPVDRALARQPPADVPGDGRPGLPGEVPGRSSRQVLGLPRAPGAARRARGRDAGVG